MTPLIVSRTVLPALASFRLTPAMVVTAGTGVSGLEWDGADLFYCGGGESGKVRAVRRPKSKEAS